MTILQPGDFFNSDKASDFLKRWVINQIRLHFLLEESGWQSVAINTVFGQHDLRYHSSDVRNTPLSVVDASGCVNILSPTPTKFGKVYLYGASWYENIRNLHADGTKLANPDSLNILVAHKMIIKNKKAVNIMEINIILNKLENFFY